MQTFTTFLLALWGAAALAAHASAQQQVTITPGDRANYQEFLKVCAQPLAAMKQLMASHGETATDAQIRELFITIPPILREQAAEEKLPVAAALSEARARMKNAADDPNNPDPSDKVLAPSMLCWLDLLLANETARAPAPAPAPAPVSTAVAVADSGGCLTIDWRGGTQGDPAVLGNICRSAINVGVCVKSPTPGSASENISCEQSRFTSYRVGGHSSVTMPATHGSVQTRVCTPPQVPAMWWENGNSIGNCR